jgi:hypothetical protein
MIIDEAKRLLVENGFTVREGDMLICFGEHEIKQPVIGVDVPPAHRCIDLDCRGVHVIGTTLAIQMMSEEALRCEIRELKDGQEKTASR